MTVAMEWVSRITALAMAMVLPGLLGYWIDSKIGTRFLAPVGFVLGIVGGIWSLLALTGAVKSRRATHKDRSSGSRDASDQ